MAEEHAINAVNKHYLDRIMNLAEETDIKATEDIYDASGMKLVAKGARISRGLQERLMVRRLSKPFESCIAVEAGVDIDLVAKEAKRIAEQAGPVRSILEASGGGPSPLHILSEISFGSAMSTMLTLIGRGGSAALEHSVTVSLLSICLARKFGLSIKDQTVVALAGLLHDIGELYIEPEYLSSKRRLYPHEWRHVVVHPRIGQMLIKDLENYPPAVAQAVFEHHERFDGGGYPRQIIGAQISAAGQVISVAEMISGVFTSKSRPLERAELALKIIPGEHAHELVSAVSSAMQSARATWDGSEGRTVSGDQREYVQQLYECIGHVLETGQELLDQAGPKSKRLVQLLSDALRRIGAVQRAFSGAGLDACLEQGSDFFETHSVEILFEAAVATKEIQWRLRDVARDLSLHASALDATETDLLQPLIAVLDGDPSQLHLA
jgi:HD-GYP domain-containing protein (c-di-GMP phosphodiesterase class II)